MQKYLCTQLKKIAGVRKRLSNVCYFTGVRRIAVVISLRETARSDIKGENDCIGNVFGMGFR